MSQSDSTSDTTVTSTEGASPSTPYTGNITLDGASGHILRRLQIALELPQTQSSFSAQSQAVTVLKAEVDGLALAQQLPDAVNPKRSPLERRVILLVKKALRRTMAWHTTGVARALQQIVGVLQNHDLLLHDLSQRAAGAALANRGPSSAANAQQLELQARVSRLEQELRSLREEVRAERESRTTETPASS